MSLLFCCRVSWDQMTSERAETELRNDRYQESISGSILLPLATNSSLKIFDYLRHANFDQFQRCFNVYHQELIHMRNDRGQVKTDTNDFLFRYS